VPREDNPKHILCVSAGKSKYGRLMDSLNLDKEIMIVLEEIKNSLLVLHDFCS